MIIVKKLCELMSTRERHFPKILGERHDYKKTRAHTEKEVLAHIKDGIHIPIKDNCAEEIIKKMI